MASNIETLDDWNQRITACGCCGMPGADAPELIYDSRTIHPELMVGYHAPGEVDSVLIGVAGNRNSPAGSLDMVYSSKVEIRTESHSSPGSTDYAFRYTQTWSLKDGDNFWGRVQDYNDDTSSTGYKHSPCGLNYTGNVTLTGNATGFNYVENIASKPDHYEATHRDNTSHSIEYSGGVDVSDTYDRQLARCPAYFTQYGGFDSTDHLIEGSEPARITTSTKTVSQSGTTYDSIDEWTSSRYRFRVPSSHLGSYFKITWDLLSEPDDGDPTLESEDMTVEWVGPGNPEDPDDDSWLTDWNEIPMLTDPGEKRVVNIRYQSYKSSKFGNKPQVTGEAFDPQA